MDRDFQIERDRITFRLQTAIYPTIVVLKAAYIFIDRYYVGLSMNRGDIVVSMRGKASAVNETDVGEFYNELLNQLLRLYVQRETKNIRELIMARALHLACLETEDDGGTPDDDTGGYRLDEIIQDWCAESVENG